MAFIRWTLILFCLLQTAIYSVTGNMTVEYFLSNPETGYLNGKKNIIFALFASKNITIQNSFAEFCDPNPNITLWCEEARVTINQGVLNHTLGLTKPLKYTFFKKNDLRLGLYIDNYNQDGTGDHILLPIVSVPSSFYSQYADVAAEIEDTEDWLKIDKVNKRIGIGTLTPSYNLDVAGTINAIGIIADNVIIKNGYEITGVDYNKLVNLDDYSLSPFDGVDGPTVDVVFVTSSQNVGIGIDITQNIQEKLHVSGNILVENGIYKGMRSNIEIFGESPYNTASYDNLPQLIWSSKKRFFRAGRASSGIWSHDLSGEYSVAFGQDNRVRGQYSFSAGKSNEITGEYSIIGSGNNNRIYSNYSGILSGDSNSIHSNSNYSFIGGGSINEIGSHGTSTYSSILGGHDNIIKKGQYSVILGGKGNTIQDADYSVSFGKYTTISPNHDHVFLFGGDLDKCLLDSNCKSYSSQQFIVYAKNGLGVGTANVKGSNPTNSDSFDKNAVYTSVPNNSIRVLGDIIALDEDNKLGYIFADGRYLKNIKTAWSYYTDTNEIWVTGNAKVGIGTSTPNTSLHLKDNSSQQAILRIEDDDESKLDLFLSSNTAVIQSNKGLTIKNNEIEMIKISTPHVSIESKLFIGLDLNSTNLQVTGDATFTGRIDSEGVSANGTITANVFVGDGSQLRNVNTDALNHYDDTNGGAFVTERVVVKRDNNGFVGIGTATGNPTSMVHIGNTFGPQLKIENTNLITNYATFQSSDRFSIEFLLDDTSLSNESTIFELIASGDGIVSNSGTFRKIIDVYKKGDIILDVAGQTLSVNGTVEASYFKGDGNQLTNIQIDREQINNVTFNNTVHIINTLNVRSIVTEFLEVSDQYSDTKTYSTLNVIDLNVGSDTNTSLTYLHVTGNSKFIGNVESNGILVNGTITANSFVGNGQNLTGIQLDTVQNNNVSFSKTVSISTLNIQQVLKLVPMTTVLVCTSSNEGTIFSIDKDTSSGTDIDICACYKDGITAKSLLTVNDCTIP